MKQQIGVKMKLEGKIAIVTGSSSGMGHDIALAYAKEGATVFAVARRLDRLNLLIEEASDLPGKIVAHAADLSKKEQVESMVEACITTFGKLDILVNNAGIMDDMSGIANASDEMYDMLFDVNVRAPFVAMRNAVAYFEQHGGGNIINISSIGGLKGGVAGVTYVASKHALLGITKNTAYMYALKNIRCNAICPGAIITEIGTTENMKHLNQEGAERCGIGLALNPRFGAGSEIASVAVFLASEDSSFINGQNIVVDGGWSAS